MPIILKVGQKSLKIRMVIAGIYAVLIVGGFTMVYPFLIMISTSVTDYTDYQEYRVIPQYLTNDDALYTKYLYHRYNSEINEFNLHHGTNYFDWKEVFRDLKKYIPQKTPTKACLNDWREFMSGLGLYQKGLHFFKYREKSPQQAPFLLETQYADYLKKIFHNDFSLLVERYRSDARAFNEEIKPFEDLQNHSWIKDAGVKIDDWENLKKTFDPDFYKPLEFRNSYRFFLKKKYSKMLYLEESAKKPSRYDEAAMTAQALNILNKKWKTNFSSFEDIVLPLRVPESPGHAEDWESYARTVYPARLITLTKGNQQYQALIEKTYKTISNLNKTYSANYKSFKDIPFPGTVPNEKVRAIDFMRFVDLAAPTDAILLMTAEDQYIDFLKKKYNNSITDLCRAYDWDIKNFESAVIPRNELDYAHMMSTRKELKKYFLSVNYKMVFEKLFQHGGAMINTLLLIVMIVGTHLTVNPLCAYALSRFQLSYTNKILIFLLATMAFPGEVTMITSFLQIKELGMLNSLWGLVLPGMVSGFGIFLLKGFFDSLPQELYEAAILDGAGEMRLFWQITVPMSMPILAVIGLGAFGGAYSIYMSAILICQDPNKWPLMVFLQQFQQGSSPPIVMASLVISAIPTLLVFILAQKVIMKGIVIPQFK